MEGNYLHLFVKDTGAGISAERLEELTHSLQQVKAAASSSDAETFVDALNRFSEERPASRTADIQSEQQLETDRENRYVSNNIGMRNVYQRLLLNYKNQCSMEISSDGKSGTVIHIQADYRMLEHH